MKKSLIGFYNVHLDCYDDPISVQLTIDQIQETYRRSILSAPDKAFESHMQEKRLVQFGTWDDFDGSFELFDHPKQICEMSKFFPAGYLAKKIAHESAMDAAFMEAVKHANGAAN